MELRSTDKPVTFGTFATNAAARPASFMKEDKDGRECLSQREAFRESGEANVRRRHRQGEIRPCKRPGKAGYPAAGLKGLSGIQQDCL